MYGQYKRINQHCGQFGKGLLWGGSPAYTQVREERGRREGRKGKERRSAGRVRGGVERERRDGHEMGKWRESA
jgi:hypothetical protein